jgi:hypothetical protein
MGIKTPHSVKVRVIKEWIRGISRDQIASNNEIGAGTVTSILQQTKSNYPHYDMDLMRELALKLKKENLDLNYFTSAVRLKKVLDRLEMTEENVELFLEEINIHCFKKKLNKKEFISKIDEVWKISKSLDVPIFNIPSHIQNLTKYLAELKKDTIAKEREIEQKFEEYDITTTDLDEYRLNRPIVDKINILESELFDKEIETESLKGELLKYKIKIMLSNNSKSVSEIEFIDANNWLPEKDPLNIEELSKITEEIYYPGRSVKIIEAWS